MAAHAKDPSSVEKPSSQGSLSQKKVGRQKKSGRGVSGRKLAFWVVFCPCLLFFLPSVTLLGALMLPTIIVSQWQNQEARHLVFSVGLTNIAGALPALHALWDGGQTFSAAFAVLQDPRIWLVDFGAAAVGMAIFVTMPLFTLMYYQVASLWRVAYLKEQQKDLVSVWGAEVESARVEAESGDEII